LLKKLRLSVRGFTIASMTDYLMNTQQLPNMHTHDCNSIFGKGNRLIGKHISQESTGYAFHMLNRRKSISELFHLIKIWQSMFFSFIQ